VAALDRQHPRDLFDIRDLLANEGINDELRRAFIVYLISHDRLIFELVAPRRKDLAQEFAQGFAGMTTEPVALGELAAVREALIATIIGEMPVAHRDFLLRFKRGEPDWGLVGLPEAANLPAVRWKQLNLDKLAKNVRACLVNQLSTALSS